MKSITLKKPKKKYYQSLAARKEAQTAYGFVAPYVLLFFVFIILPVSVAIYLSFTKFDLIGTPEFVGVNNYVYLLTSDEEFMKNILPNTLKYSLIVGPVGYLLSFLLAWLLAQIPAKARNILAIIIYSPSLTAGVTMSVVWKIIFAGDSSGYINSLLLQLNLIVEPIQFLQSEEWLLPIMIIVSLWSSMGIGFLAMLSGILNIDQSLYEAAYMDGMKSKFQEIFYITVPAMKPQMLFGAVMAIVNTFSSGGIGVALSGSNPTPNYAGSLIVNHIEDYAYLRYDMGIAASLSVLLLILIYFLSKVVFKLLAEND